MPVGIPKVPFQEPEEEDADWVDLYNGLYRSRAIFLGKRLDEETSTQIQNLLVYLDIRHSDRENRDSDGDGDSDSNSDSDSDSDIAIESNRDIFFYINSRGGSIISGVAIYDLMQAVQPDVQTLCVGIAASMAAFLLVGGEITKRLAFPHARVMMHQPECDLHDKTLSVDYVTELIIVKNLYLSIVDAYAKRTGKDHDIIHMDIQRCQLMTARETQDYGIIDYITREKYNYL
uniref:ATP-dependent Clp protease proteolytic subunit n=1 Tax=Acacia andrewsii TaxID=1174712 RepID=A0A1D0C5W9_9FABA|nr:clpP1 [Acacia andrewsii]